MSRVHSKHFFCDFSVGLLLQFLEKVTLLLRFSLCRCSLVGRPLCLCSINGSLGIGFFSQPSLGCLVYRMGE